jgi:IclR family KDG regulon transcriptional repressor
MDQRTASRDFESAPSAVKVLRVLEFVATAGQCALNDLVAATGLPKSTLLRLLALLIDEGYLERSAHGRYRAALKLWRLGCGAVGYEDVREHVLPVLRGLVERTGETAHYAVYDDGRATYVEKVDGSHPIRAYTSVGSSSPAYATATGKALLAWQRDTEIERVLGSAVPYSPSTLVTPEEFKDHAASVRDVGYAVNRGEWREGVWGVAAPIFGRHGEAVAAVGVSGPADRVAPKTDEYGEAVLGAAEHLSALRGYQPLRDLGAGGPAARTFAPRDPQAAGR